MSGPVADFRDTPLTAEELAMLDRARAGELVAKRRPGAKRVLPLAAEVIGMDIRRVKAERVGALAGRLIGIGIFGGIVYVARGMAWVARRVRR